MVLFLRLNVLQHRLDLIRAHRKRTIPTLPEKTARAGIKCFDPLRGYLLYPLDELSSGNSSRERGDNVNVIGDTAHAQGLAIQIATNRCQISVHARSYGRIKPRLAILRAKDDMNDDSTERLRHGGDNRATRLGNESRFQRCALGRNYFPGRCPRLLMSAAPLALTGYNRPPRMPSKCAPWHNSVSPNASAPSSGDQLRQITAALATVLKMHY